MSLRPEVKGWCPGAFRPMMSGDGLVVRVRPRQGRLEADQVAALTTLARAYGSGVVDLTTRANLQIRGVTEAAYPALLAGLRRAGLLDATPELEARRNILTTPFPDRDGLTSQLHDDVAASLGHWPNLPAKMGVAIDTGDDPMLSQVSADFRFERDAEGQVILRADGAETGVPVSRATAVTQLLDLAAWFNASGGAVAGRMGRHLHRVTLPQAFQGTAPRPAPPPPEPGPCADGFLVGAAFGAIEAADLQDLMRATGARAVRVTPWRMLLLEGVPQVTTDAFVTAPGDPLLALHACPGAPLCTQAQAPTRDLARRLASRVPAGTGLHISGCAKGCAHPRPADVTLVGVEGKFDLVRAGTAWEEPAARGLSVDDILKELTR